MSPIIGESLAYAENDNLVHLLVIMFFIVPVVITLPIGIKYGSENLAAVDFDTLGMGMENRPVYTTEVSWSYHATALHMEMSFDFGDTSQVFYEMSMSNDGSGDYTYTQNGDLTYSASWNANGTGQWTNHMTSPPIVTYW
tara:strand:- start:1655 stop:2074 length:420 start_codon:yes stop_codon:yes gene_type:complete